MEITELVLTLKALHVTTFNYGERGKINIHREATYYINKTVNTANTVNIIEMK